METATRRPTKNRSAAGQSRENKRKILLWAINDFRYAARSGGERRRGRGVRQTGARSPLPNGLSNAVVQFVFRSHGL
jgi:hypothetical protein